MKKKTQKIKRGIFVALAFGMLISNVYAITSDGVTYDNQGNTEVLTDTLDGLLREADKYKTGGTVTANQMLKGATGYAKGELVTGTIESKGAETYTPGTKNQTISSGVYLSGTQTIKGDANLKGANIAAGKTIFGVSGTFTSDANAAAGHILSGKTAYVNGSKVTGTIESKGATTYTPGTSNQTINAGQYLSGNQTIVGDANLTGANIVSGKSIFGVWGSHTAQNHSYEVLKAEFGATQGGCGWSWGYMNKYKSGKIIAWMDMTATSGGVNTNTVHNFSKNSVSIAPTTIASGEYAGAWTFITDFNAGDSIDINFNLTSVSGFKSCGLYVVLVS